MLPWFNVHEFSTSFLTRGWDLGGGKTSQSPNQNVLCTQPSSMSSSYHTAGRQHSHADRFCNKLLKVDFHEAPPTTNTLLSLVTGSANLTRPVSLHVCEVTPMDQPSSSSTCRSRTRTPTSVPPTPKVYKQPFQDPRSVANFSYPPFQRSGRCTQAEAPRFPPCQAPEQTTPSLLGSSEGPSQAPSDRALL